MTDFFKILKKFYNDYKKLVLIYCFTLILLIFSVIINIRDLIFIFIFLIIIQSDIIVDLFKHTMNNFKINKQKILNSELYNYIFNYLENLPRSNNVRTIYVSNEMYHNIPIGYMFDKNYIFTVDKNRKMCSCGLVKKTDEINTVNDLFYKK
jgi:hypothetical protein